MKSVAIIGCAETSYRLIAKHKPKSLDVWPMNQLYKEFPEIMQYATRWYQLHSRETILKFHPDSWDWYKKSKIPVYVQNQYAKQAKNFRSFPKDKVLTMLPRRYIDSMCAWVIAHAIYEKYECIYIYGVDFSLRWEYMGQRPNMEWLIGYAEGKGIQVVVPDESDLCKSQLLYAYEDKPNVVKKVQNEQQRWQSKILEKEQEMHKISAVINQSLGMLNFARKHNMGTEEEYEELERNIRTLREEEKKRVIESSQCKGIVEGIKYMAQGWLGYRIE